MSASLELQAGIIATLGATIPNAFGAVAPVFDYVKQDQVAPYVTISDTTMSDYSSDGSTGFNALVTIHTWSDYRGDAECKYLQGQIYDLLQRADVPVVGFNVLGCDFVADNGVSLDPNGITKHGVQQFRVLMIKV